MKRQYTNYGNNFVQIWEDDNAIAVIPNERKGTITKVLNGGRVPKKYRGISYDIWMSSLNNRMRQWGRIQIRNKNTWQAFCQGITPMEFFEANHPNH